MAPRRCHFVPFQNVAADRCGCERTPLPDTPGLTTSNNSRYVIPGLQLGSSSCRGHENRGWIADLLSLKRKLGEAKRMRHCSLWRSQSNGTQLSTALSSESFRNPHMQPVCALFIPHIESSIWPKRPYTTLDSRQFLRKQQPIPPQEHTHTHTPDVYPIGLWRERRRGWKRAL